MPHIAFCGDQPMSSESATARPIISLGMDVPQGLDHDRRTASWRQDTDAARAAAERSREAEEVAGAWRARARSAPATRPAARGMCCTARCESGAMRATSLRRLSFRNGPASNASTTRTTSATRRISPACIGPASSWPSTSPRKPKSASATSCAAAKRFSARSSSRATTS